MVTKKKAVATYLPPDIEQYLTEYCKQYNITRKDQYGKPQPALGTGVVDVLKRFFSLKDIPAPLPDHVPVLPPNAVTKSELEEVVNNAVTIDMLQAEIAKAIATLKQELPEDANFIESVYQKF